MKHKLKIALILGVEFVAVAIMLILIFLSGKKQYTVTFDLNGGTLLSGNLEQSVTQGHGATPPSAFKDGHYLRGWSGNYNNITHDVTVYAIWEYETTPGIEYSTKTGRTYSEISGCFKQISGKVYVGAYYNNLIIFSILDSAFQDCYKIEELHFLNGVITIGEKAFSGCKALSVIDLPNTATSIGREAFKNCISLESIKLPKSLETLGSSAFVGCESLSEITFYNSLVEIEDGAFYGCESITELTLPKSLKIIGESAFENCTGLEEIHIPSTVELIADNAFRGCENLKKVVFYDVEDEDKNETDEDDEDTENIEDEEEIIANLVIRSNAFSDCVSLESINLPKTLREIKDNTFTGCSSLEYIVIPENTESLGKHVFDTPDIKIYVYFESEDQMPEEWTLAWNTENTEIIFGYNGEKIETETDDNADKDNDVEE